MRLTTGQARTRVLGMTFRPGPSPLGGPRPRNSKKDGGEKGTASGEDWREPGGREPRPGSKAKQAAI